MWAVIAVLFGFVTTTCQTAVRRIDMGLLINLMNDLMEAAPKAKENDEIEISDLMLVTYIILAVLMLIFVSSNW